jgi:membrane protein DedA with SNARE-associated domain
MDTLRVLVTHWGYLAIFTGVLLGNLGIPVPESSILWVAGFLVWKGRLALVPVLLVGIVAAVAGDNCGYWVGRRCGGAVVNRYGGWVCLTPERLDRMRQFVHRYGPFGVFIARFVTGLRFMAGPLAGSLGLPPLAFFMANVLGAVCYVPLTVGTAYAVGYGFRRYAKRFLLGEDTLEEFLLLGAGLVIVLLLTRQGIRHLRKRCARGPRPQ